MGLFLALLRFSKTRVCFSESYSTANYSRDMVYQKLLLDAQCKVSTAQTSVELAQCFLNMSKFSLGTVITIW